MPGRPRIGERVVHHVKVAPEMTARLFDREMHPVYGTAWLVRHVEEAGRLLVEPHLGPQEDATGYSMSVTHERPAPVGTEVSIEGVVTDVNDRMCAVEVTVRAPFGVVGRATFVQRYVPRGWLEEKTRRGESDHGGDREE